MIWKARKGPAYRNLSGIPQEVKIRQCYIASSLSYRENPSSMNPSSSVHLLKLCDCVSPSGGGAQLPSLLSFSIHYTIIDPEIWVSVARSSLVFIYGLQRRKENSKDCSWLSLIQKKPSLTHSVHVVATTSILDGWKNGEWGDGENTMFFLDKRAMCEYRLQMQTSAFWFSCTWNTDWKENGQKGLHS